MMVFSRSAGEAARIGDLLVVVKAIEEDRVVFEINLPKDARMEEYRNVVMVWTDCGSDQSQPSPLEER
jgi:sRNA-binding carbon storage regulator CsrA